MQLAVIAGLHQVHGAGHFRLVPLNLRPVGGWQYEDRQPPSAKVLLKPQILIRRDEDLKPPLGLARQVARERDTKVLACLDRREPA